MKNFVKVIISMILSIFLVLSFNIFDKAAAETTYFTTKTAVKMYSGAGTNYKVLLTIPSKTKVKAVSSKKVKKTTWYKIKYKQKNGWVNGKYLTEIKVKDKFNLTTGKFYKNVYTIKNPNNILVLVNKNNKLSKNFVPSNLRVVKTARRSNSAAKMNSTAAKQLEKMFKAAAKDGIYLGAYSGYRSYKTQQAAYQKYKNDWISARPGHSEHQTGLAMDVIAKRNLKKSGSKALTKSFGNTKEGKWLAKNAHKYGFIIRYPKGKEKVTGYNYEPWHIRYVGVKVASTLYEKNWTLEEAYINGYLK